MFYRKELDEVFVEEGAQQVRKVHLNFFSRGNRGEDSKALERILEAFNKARFFQTLEEISIFSQDVECSYSQLGFCLQSAINARTITIDVRLYYLRPAKPVPIIRDMTRLRSLTVNCPPILDYIDTAHPVSLTLTPGDRTTMRNRKLNFQMARCDDHGMLDLLDTVNPESYSVVVTPLYFVNTLIYTHREDLVG